MRRAARVDRNQQEIVDALRRVGASVVSLAAVGHGVPDLLVGFRGYNILMEVKADGGRLTKEQIRWHQEWRGQVAIVVDPESAIRILEITTGERLR